MGMDRGRLGKYELQEHSGSDAVGEVWKAFDTAQRCCVAIKIIPLNPQDGNEFYHRAQILAQLHHPHIVQVLDYHVSQSGGEAYLSMEYVEGPTLAAYLDATAHRGKIPPPAEIMRLLTPVAEALDYAHQRRVVHGALTPAAILLADAGSGAPAPAAVKLTAFSLHFLHNPLALQLPDVSYMAPEMAQGFAGTERSDLYSLGVILYEMCTGVLPFQGDSPGDMLMQHIHGTPTSPALINPYIPPALTAAIMRSLARDPTARFPTATVMLATVAKALNMGAPEKSAYSHQAPQAVKASSPEGGSGSLDLYGPTSLGRPSQELPSMPPLVASRNTPPLSPSAGASITPALSPAPSEVTPALQEPEKSSVSPATAGTPVRTTPPGPPLEPHAASQAAAAPVPTPPPQKRRPRWFYFALLAALLLALAGSVLGAYLIRITSPAQATVVGHAFFVSSGLLSDNNSNQGITDELQVNLQNLSAPQAGKRYYAWLLNDQNVDLPAVAIGALPLNHGQVSMMYRDPQHNNLLANYGHFLVTEEDANAVPSNPSLDPSTWRYNAAFSTTPNPADTLDHFSLLAHLRHLLSQDPKLKLVGLGGGLDIWLYRNTSKVLEDAGNARDTQPSCTADPNSASCAFVHRSLVRILDYLDGSAYAWQDLPANSPLLIDPTIARVALLERDVVHQQPPGYLQHIGTHLREITQSPGVTPAQYALAIHITQAIDNIQVWLDAVRSDALKLVGMNNSQMSQAAALSILNDLYTQANHAFVGQFDPNTATVKEGVVQIHYNIQRLATFDVTQCTPGNGTKTCA